jgi:hypothetical protein
MASSRPSGVGLPLRSSSGGALSWASVHECFARHLIEAHGGTLVAENPPAGGALPAASSTFTNSSAPLRRFSRPRLVESKRQTLDRKERL